MAEGLDRVENWEALYFARGADVQLHRPLMQGDVFGGITIPGVEDDGENLAQIITHPCSMRQGPILKQHLQMIRVSRFQKPKPSWSLGHFGLMPLQDLRPDEPGVTYAGHFDLAGRVESAQLSRAARIACLSPEGVSHLQQRYVHFLTRVKVDLPKLLEVSMPMLEEADLEEEWIQRLLEGCPLHQVEAQLIEEARSFDRLMSERRKPLEDAEASSLREDLRRIDRRAAVRRAVHDAIRHRLGGEAPPREDA